MRLFKTPNGPLVEEHGVARRVSIDDWDALINHPDRDRILASAVERGAQVSVPQLPLAPIGKQELWAAGVTYERSRSARTHESERAGAADFYHRVHHADRPELFFKATPHRVQGPGGTLHLRSDSRWIVPEPELTVVIDRRGGIVGYTAGDDLSCRDIEADNPLYLPQAKIFDRCAAVGPAIWIRSDPPPPETEIELLIERAGTAMVSAKTELARLQRSIQSLIAYLFRDNVFPDGCLLMTGTGIVPPDEFSLAAGDRISIRIGEIGTLTHSVD